MRSRQRLRGRRRSEREARGEAVAESGKLFDACLLCVVASHNRPLFSSRTAFSLSLLFVLTSRDCCRHCCCCCCLCRARREKNGSSYSWCRWSSLATTSSSSSSPPSPSPSSSSSSFRFSSLTHKHIASSCRASSDVTASSSSF